MKKGNGNVSLLIKGSHILEELNKTPAQYVNLEALRKLDEKQHTGPYPLPSTFDLLNGLANAGFIDKKTYPARYKIQEKGQVGLEKLKELRDICR
jgi:hypothetical protein